MGEKAAPARKVDAPLLVREVLVPEGGHAVHVGGGLDLGDQLDGLDARELGAVEGARRAHVRNVVAG